MERPWPNGPARRRGHREGGNPVIGLLRGAAVQRTGEGEVIIDVGGMGYRVAVTPATAAALVVGGAGGAGSEATLYVHTHVREDAIVLYGFVHDDERRCFEVASRLARRGSRTGAGHHGGTVPGGPVHCRPRGRPRHPLHGARRGAQDGSPALIELKSRLDLPDLSLSAAGAGGSGGGTGASDATLSRTSRAEARAALSDWATPQTRPRCAGRPTGSFPSDRQCFAETGRSSSDSASPGRASRWALGRAAGPSPNTRKNQG